MLVVLLRAVVRSAVSGASCGLELTGAGPFVVFAQRSGEHLHAGLFGGTAPLTPELDAALDRLPEPAPPRCR